MLATTSFVVFFLALWTGLALAQTGSQNASIPNCVRACDTQAIKASNCTSVDQYCHCITYATILDSIIPCVYHNSTCTNATADLLTFERLFDDVCQKFNLSVPTNVTGNSTSLLKPSPSPYISQASADTAWPLETTLSIYAFVLTAFYFGVFL